MSFQDIRKMRKGWGWEDIRFLVLLCIALAALLALNIYLARTLPGGEWLSLRWNGARAFMFEASSRMAQPLPSARSRWSTGEPHRRASMGMC